MYIKNNIIQDIFWFLTLTMFMFQCYNRSLASLIVPCVFLFLVTEIPALKWYRKWSGIFVIYTAFLTISICLAVGKGTDLRMALRFFLILFFIPLFGMIHDRDFNRKWFIFKFLSVIKAATIIGIWIVVFVIQDYTAFRHWAQTTGAGDIYIIGFIPRVQILGNTLFTMGFGLELFREKKLTPYAAVMFVASICAGNSAYILGNVMFLACIFIPIFYGWMRKKDRKFFISIPFVVLGMCVFIFFAISVLQGKADFSNAVRIGQAKLLLDANPIWGEGLGHAITGTVLDRVYHGDTYFELQTLYIFNQIGLIGLGLFYTLTFYPYVCKRNYKQIFAYLVYLAYVFWNPYCFDSTHMIVLTLITNVLSGKQIKYTRIFLFGNRKISCRIKRIWIN